MNFQETHPFWAYLLGIHFIFIVNTWTSMVPWFLLTTEASNSSPGSAHFSPMASQALCHGTCDGTVAISERNGSAQVGFYMLFDGRLPIKLTWIFVEKHLFGKKGEDFLRSFILGGWGWNVWCYTFEIFWLTWYLFWVLEVCFGAHQYPLETSLVPKRTSDEPT